MSLLGFLADECADNRMAVALRDAGHEVIAVSEIMPSATDEDVAERLGQDLTEVFVVVTPGRARIRRLRRE